MIRSLTDVKNSIACAATIKTPPPATPIGAHRDPPVAVRRDWLATEIKRVNVTLNYFEKFCQNLLHAAINILNCLYNYAILTCIHIYLTMTWSESQTRLNAVIDFRSESFVPYGNANFNS